MNNNLPTRRDVLKQAATGAAIAAWSSPLTLLAKDASATEPLPIIDTHQHLWDLSKFTLPWHADAGDDSVLKKNYVTADYLAATKGLNVVQTVYMEVDVAPEQQNAEADYVLDLCQRNDNPMTGAVISGRPASAEFAKYMERFTGNPFIKGVRQVLHGESTPAGYCLQKPFIESIKLLGEMGKRFDLCMRSGELLDAVKLVDQCPKTKFVLDHCGNGPVAPKAKSDQDKADFERWYAGLVELAKRPHVVCKISGIVAGAPKNWEPADLAAVIYPCLDAFGEDRVMFAGDWPVCLLRASFQQWVAALKEIVQNRSPEFRRKLFHDNALKFYDLPAKKGA
ncbi:MAG: amidohydrolase family protein [Planctomycetaceae bacterium]